MSSASIRSSSRRSALNSVNVEGNTFGVPFTSKTGTRKSARNSRLHERTGSSHDAVADHPIRLDDVARRAQRKLDGLAKDGRRRASEVRVGQDVARREIDPAANGSAPSRVF